LESAFRSLAPVVAPREATPSGAGSSYRALDFPQCRWYSWRSGLKPLTVDNAAPHEFSSRLGFRPRKRIIREKTPGVLQVEHSNKEAFIH
jgi:hypothetical protein